MPAGEINELSFAGGLAAGFASSLHCAAMCGGVSASLMLALPGDRGLAGRAQILLLTHAGRITAYMLAGAAVGLAGSALYMNIDREAAWQVMRWASAALLAWIGLSLAGWAPAPAALDRIARPLARSVATASGRVSVRMGPAAPFAAGLAWGAMPCGMVYVALMFAMIAGGPGQGAIVMAGFGLGALPALTATAFGAAGLAQLARSDRVRRIAGASIVTIAVVSIAPVREEILRWCGF